MTRDEALKVVREEAKLRARSGQPAQTPDRDLIKHTHEWESKEYQDRKPKVVVNKYNREY